MKIILPPLTSKGMSCFAILEAPSILGFRPTGVENLPEALKAAGLLEALNAQYLGSVHPLVPYSPEQNNSTHLLNDKAIQAFSLQCPAGIQ
jgi:arginase